MGGESDMDKKAHQSCLAKEYDNLSNAGCIKCTPYIVEVADDKKGIQPKKNKKPKMKLRIL